MSKKVKGHVWKTKVSLICRGVPNVKRSLLTALFLVQALLSKVNLGSRRGDSELFLHLQCLGYFQFKIVDAKVSHLGATCP